jgi:hypothetical protein
VACDVFHPCIRDVRVLALLACFGLILWARGALPKGGRTGAKGGRWDFRPRTGHSVQYVSRAGQIAPYRMGALSGRLSEMEM